MTGMLVDGDVQIHIIGQEEEEPEERFDFIDYDWDEVTYYKLKLSEEIDKNDKLTAELAELKERYKELKWRMEGLEK